MGYEWKTKKLDTKNISETLLVLGSDGFEW